MAVQLKKECYLIGGTWVPVWQVETLQKFYKALLDAQSVANLHGILTEDATNKALAQMVNFFRSGGL